MVDQSPSQGHGQEQGVWSRVKSWFLRFLTWARRVILLSDRDVRDSNATTAMSQRHGRNRRALWPLTMLGDLGGSHEVSAKGPRMVYGWHSVNAQYMSTALISPISQMGSPWLKGAK